MNLQKKLKEKQNKLESLVKQYNQYVKLVQELSNKILLINGEIKVLKELEIENNKGKK